MTKAYCKLTKLDDINYEICIVSDNQCEYTKSTIQIDNNYNVYGNDVTGIDTIYGIYNCDKTTIIGEFKTRYPHFTSAEGSIWVTVQGSIFFEKVNY